VRSSSLLPLFVVLLCVYLLLVAIHAVPVRAVHGIHVPLCGVLIRLIMLAESIGSRLRVSLASILALRSSLEQLG
jgi:hypothetical protein